MYFWKFGGDIYDKSKIEGSGHKNWGTTKRGDAYENCCTYKINQNYNNEITPNKF